MPPVRLPQPAKCTTRVALRPLASNRLGGHRGGSGSACPKTAAMRYTKSGSGRMPASVENFRHASAFLRWWSKSRAEESLENQSSRIGGKARKIRVQSVVSEIVSETL